MVLEYEKAKIVKKKATANRPVGSTGSLFPIFGNLGGLPVKIRFDSRPSLPVLEYFSIAVT